MQARELARLMLETDNAAAEACINTRDFSLPALDALRIFLNESDAIEENYIGLRLSFRLSFDQGSAVEVAAFAFDTIREVNTRYAQMPDAVGENMDEAVLEAWSKDECIGEIDLDSPKGRVFTDKARRVRAIAGGAK